MILAELLQELAAAGVILVISSNTKPDDLYANGVQRKRFLPAIILLKRDCEVLYLQEQRDYRVGREPLVAAYLSPLNDETAALMQQQFNQLVPERGDQGKSYCKIVQYLFTSKEKLQSGFYFEILCNFPAVNLII